MEFPRAPSSGPNLIRCRVSLGIQRAIDTADIIEENPPRHGTTEQGRLPVQPESPEKKKKKKKKKLEDIIRRVDFSSTTFPMGARQ